MHIIETSLIIPSNHYKKILMILNEARAKARLIGGCVRDAILNKRSNDIDIATNLVPQEVVKIFKNAGVRTIPTGIKFGTITVILENEQFQITTLREDIKCLGRHSIVQFTNDFAQDAKRRDFTINALSYCPFECKLYDYFTGLQDLQNKKVVFIGQPEERIKEDYLRILRFFRFSSYYAVKIDSEGASACSKLQEGLRILSRERIKEEFDKLLMSPNSYMTLDLMFKSGILKLLFSIEIFIPEILQQAAILKTSLATRYALLLYNQDLQLTTLINWKFSKQEAGSILSLYHFIHLSTVNLLTLKKLWLEKQEYREYLLIAVITGKLSAIDAESFINKYDELTRPKFPITGHDLININIGQKEISHKLQYLKKIWIETNFSKTKDELLNIIKNYEK